MKGLSLSVIVILLIMVQRRQRKRHYLTRMSLTLPNKSAWRALFDSRQDNAFICCMGFDVNTFMQLHNAIHRDIWHHNTKQGGRPPLLDTYASLGLCLHYLNSTMRCKTLSQIFGASPSTVNRTLYRTLCALRFHLAHLPCARIQWPSAEEMTQFAMQIEHREPSLKNSFAFVDGVWFPVQEPSDPLTQNAYYNGWKSCCNVTNVIAFTPDGCICWVRFNQPGSWHDSAVAQPLYHLLMHHTPPPFNILADTAFPRFGELEKKILTPLKRNQLSEDPVIRGIQMEGHRSVTSVRQAAEWGMHAVQSVIARIQIRLHYNKHIRALILECVFRLYNVRARCMKLNQITTVFDEDYVPSIYDANTAERIRRYYKIDE